MGLAKTVVPSFKNSTDRLSRHAALFSFITLWSFNTVSSDTIVNLIWGTLVLFCSIVVLKVINKISKKREANYQVNCRLVNKNFFENVGVFLSLKLVNYSLFKRKFLLRNFWSRLVLEFFRSEYLISEFFWNIFL